MSGPVTEARRVARPGFCAVQQDRAAWTQVLRELLNRIQAPGPAAADPQHQPRLPMTMNANGSWTSNRNQPPRDGPQPVASALLLARGPP